MTKAKVFKVALGSQTGEFLVKHFVSLHLGKEEVLNSWYDYMGGVGR